MRTLYTLNVTVHVLAAMLWLGGMLFLAAVGAPVIRRLPSDELRARLFRQIGERFRMVGWICIGVLLVTGTLNLQFRGLLGSGALLDGAFWGTGFGRALAGKLGAVAAMIALSAVHDFVHGPRATRLEPGSPEALRFRRRAVVLGRLNALLGIAAVWAAVVLARGG